MYLYTIKCWQCQAESAIVAGSETKVDRLMVSIRRLTDQDQEACVRLGRMMHAESKYAHIAFDDTSVMLLHRQIMRGQLQAWVAEVDGAVVGFICISVNNYFFAMDMSTASDLVFYIRPEHRNYCVARELIKAVEHWCITNNVHSLVLGITAPEDATATSALYKHFGYSNWGTIMRKEFT